MNLRCVLPPIDATVFRFAATEVRALRQFLRIQFSLLHQNARQRLSKASSAATVTFWNTSTPCHPAKSALLVVLPMAPASGLVTI